MKVFVLLLHTRNPLQWRHFCILLTCVYFRFVRVCFRSGTKVDQLQPSDKTFLDVSCFTFFFAYNCVNVLQISFFYLIDRVKQSTHAVYCFIETFSSLWHHVFFWEIIGRNIMLQLLLYRADVVVLISVLYF